MPKPNRTNVPRELFDSNEIDGSIQCDWYIVPIAVLVTLVVLIIITGPDQFIEVMSDFIVGVRN